MTRILDYLACEIGKIPPGHSIRVTREILQKSEPSSVLGAFLVDMCQLGRPEDRILEKIIGSSYEFSYRTDPVTGDITFHRRTQPLADNRRTYVSPDRRDRFELLPDGTYKSKNSNKEVMS